MTGWKIFPIKLLGKNGIGIGGYHGFSVTGRGGSIDFSKSKIVEKRYLPQGPLVKFYKGLHIGLDKWDGSDFFLPVDNYGIKITKKAAEVIKSNKFTNIALRNLAEIEINKGTVDNMVPNQ